MKIIPSACAGTLVPADAVTDKDRLAGAHPQVAHAKQKRFG